MKTRFKANLHIHTVLSPCGSLEMSPSVIVAEALKNGFDIIGITDHNSTLQANVVKEIGEKNGLFVLMGAEVSSKEEVHCLTFFETVVKLKKFQDFIDAHLPNIPNNEDLFGYQVVVDKEENIVYSEEKSLLSALDVGINEIEKEVHALGGLFIPAHIDRKSNGLLSMLGFLDPEMNVDALEIHRNSNKTDVWEKYGINPKISCIKSSDAHYPDDIKKSCSWFEMSSRNFSELKDALHGLNNNRVLIDID